MIDAAKAPVTKKKENQKRVQPEDKKNRLLSCISCLTSCIFCFPYRPGVFAARTHAAAAKGISGLGNRIRWLHDEKDITVIFRILTEHVDFHLQVLNQTHCVGVIAVGAAGLF